MKEAKVIYFPSHRTKKSEPRQTGQKTVDQRGRVYSRNSWLWVDFRYLGERVREPAGLKETQENREFIRRQLDLVVAEIANGVFEFARRFPKSSHKEHFAKKEGRPVTRDPGEVFFKNYVRDWLMAMEPGMSPGQVRDYNNALKNHLLPFFGDMTFREINSVCIKRFVAHLKSCQSRYKRPFTAKTIRNYLIPLRVIFKDAAVEYEWDRIKDPFFGVRLPKVTRRRIQPFDFSEWKELMAAADPWYRLYFEFAVQTGLRPSEQVALKWDAVDDEFVHIERSRVRNMEKEDLKTCASARRIDLRPNMKKTLAAQLRQTESFDSPYVFITTKGIPIRQENLGKRWKKGFERSTVPYRTMYETRHTFASWALAAGETAGWVARTLGHVDTTMVYRTYGRYVRNPTRTDGSAFEEHYAGMQGEGAQ